MAGIIEQLASLQSGLAQVQAALGRHTRVPEMRRGTITGLSPDMVLLDGDTAATAVTGSDESLYLGARVRVQVQGRDRWVVTVAGGPQHAEFTATNAGIPSGALWGPGALVTDTGASTVAALATPVIDNIIVAASGIYAVSFYVAFSAAVAGRTFLDFTIGGGTVARTNIYPGEQDGNASCPNVPVAAGTYIRFDYLQQSGSTLSATSRIRLTRIS